MNRPNRRILIIEDEPGLVRSLTDRFRAERYAVDHATDGIEGLRKAESASWDTIVLDVMLPGMQGFDVCRRLREAGDPTPILMLTARGHTADKVVGLRFGADDYMTKPFEMVELLARVEALIRRAGRSVDLPDSSVLQIGDIRVDVRSTRVTRNGTPVDLSAREYHLLCHLLRHRDETLSRERLLRDVWGYDHAPVTRTVDVHIGQLRHKLEADPARPRYIQTVHGLGYRLTDS